MELRSRKVPEEAAGEPLEAVLPFKSKKRLSYLDGGIGSSCEKSEPSDHSFSLQTPQKRVERPPHPRYLRSVDEVKRVAQEICGRKEVTEPKCDTPVKLPKKKLKTELPLKYESLCEQFDSMVSSIRLLKLKGYASTFVNIASAVQALTNRGFSHRHLSQLKYLMPEVIDIKTTLLRDEKTSCVKPELLITLKLDSLKDALTKVNGFGFLDLSKVLRSRLAEFIGSKLEVDEVPEATLPEPFCQRAQPKISRDELLSERKRNSPYGNESNLLSVRADDGPLAAPLGCFSSRLRKHFSQKTPLLASEKTHLLSLTTPYKFNADDISSPVSASPNVTSSITSSPTKHVKISPLRPISSKKLSMVSASMDSSPSKSPVLCQDIESTPIAPTAAVAKIHNGPTYPATMLEESKPVFSEPDSDAGLMSNTPKLFTPKRARMTPESDSTPYVKAPRMKPKALNFLSPLNSKEKEGQTRRLSVDGEIVKSLPSTLLQSVQAKERKMREENETGIAEAKLRQKMIVCLPKLFDIVCLIFQSARCHVITKQELLYRIMAQQIDIVDRREIEEQLKLMQELIPEWICEKKASSGDLIFRINKITDPEALRVRLVEAGRTDT